MGEFDRISRIMYGMGRTTMDKLRGNPDVVTCSLTGAGKAHIGERGVDGIDGLVLSYLDEHPGTHAISKIARDCHIHTLIAKRIVNKYSSMNPPYVQVQ